MIFAAFKHYCRIRYAITLSRDITHDMRYADYFHAAEATLC